MAGKYHEYADELDDYEEEIQEYWDNKYSVSEIARVYDVTPEDIRNFSIEKRMSQRDPRELHRREITKPPGWKQLIIQDDDEDEEITMKKDFFEHIDTELKAYLLGLFYAKANFVKRKEKQYITLTFNEKETETYNLIKDSLGLKLQGNTIFKKDSIAKNSKTGKISNIKSRWEYRITLTNEQLVKALINSGVSNSRRNTKAFPILSNDLLFPFIRGYIDQRGWIYVSNTRTNQKTELRIIGSKTFLDTLHTKFKKFGLFGFKVEADKKTMLHKLVSTDHEQVKKALKLIYENANERSQENWNRYLKIKGISKAK